MNVKTKLHSQSITSLRDIQRGQFGAFYVTNFKNISFLISYLIFGDTNVLKTPFFSSRNFFFWLSENTSLPCLCFRMVSSNVCSYLVWGVMSPKCRKSMLHYEQQTFDWHFRSFSNEDYHHYTKELELYKNNLLSNVCAIRWELTIIVKLFLCW